MSHVFKVGDRVVYRFGPVGHDANGTGIVARIDNGQTLPIVVDTGSKNGHCGSREAPKTGGPFWFFSEGSLSLIPGSRSRFCVFREGTRGPTVLHDTQEKAEAEARRLAAGQVGVYHVMRAVKTITSKVEITEEQV